MCDIRLLKADEIEVKVKQVGVKGAQALLYKTARVDMSILDETFGAMNWETDYREIKDNLYCGIGIRDNDTKPFVWKWDCGIESREDSEGNQKKGEASDAFKRAGFKVGIGRELYTAPFIFLNVATEKADKGGYKLVDRFASFTVSDIKYNDKREIEALTIIDSNGEVVFTFPKKGFQKAKQETIKPTAPKKEEPTEDEEAFARLAIIQEDFKALGGNVEGLARYLKKTVKELTYEDFEFGVKSKTK